MDSNFLNPNSRADSWVFTTHLKADIGIQDAYAYHRPRKFKELKFIIYKLEKSDNAMHYHWQVCSRKPFERAGSPLYGIKFTSYGI